MNTVEIENLHHNYTKKGSGAPNAIDDVSFEVADGEFFVLLGPSGCGKTTTLRCVAGLERPTGGTIRLNGTPVVQGGSKYVPTNKRNIGMVFQDYAIWPHMTVFQNVAFPLTVGKRLPKGELKRRVEETLKLVRLDHLAGRHGTQLSGGQQQRVSLARALVREPAVLLLDEPLSNLDAALRERMRTELRSIQQNVGITTMLVTHDQVEALSMATRIALMQDGKIAQLGTPRELYERPASRFVAEFIGSGTIYDGNVVTTSVEGHPNRYVIETTLGKVTAVSRQPWTVGDAASLAFRPEHVEVRLGGPITKQNEFSGVVRNALYLGNGVDLHIEAGGQLLRASVTAEDESFNIGDTVNLELPVKHAVVIAS
ncbi:Putative Spermidine/putrescine ABC transporter (ATP binding protein) [metagenome]|uniref:Spermidine/putrescine ABC transporter (ATP binding protein) n=1 Tax=metagenome TaxID=256318 RepID=A0A2P2C8W6_9ZZZZ